MNVQSLAAAFRLVAAYEAPEAASNGSLRCGPLAAFISRFIQTTTNVLSSFRP
jgi:hypothetical protein